MGFDPNSVAIVEDSQGVPFHTEGTKDVGVNLWRVQATREGLPGADRLRDGARRTRKTPLICDWGRVRSRAS